jgi:hypothetical protein
VDTKYGLNSRGKVTSSSIFYLSLDLLLVGTGITWQQQARTPDLRFGISDPLLSVYMTILLQHLEPPLIGLTVDWSVVLLEMKFKYGRTLH